MECRGNQINIQTLTDEPYHRLFQIKKTAESMLNGIKQACFSESRFLKLERKLRQL